MPFRYAPGHIEGGLDECGVAAKVNTLYLVVSLGTGLHVHTC